MKSNTRALLPLLLAPLLFLGACSSKTATNDAAAAPVAGKAATIPLVITSKGKPHRFDVETAVTPEEQEQGLMFRTELKSDGGMLFPMKPPRTASFWMKNTVIPLDMLFVAPDGKIAFIGANRKPYSREPASAGVPVAGVVELRGGRAAELGLTEGDTVQWGDCAVPGTVSTPANDAPRFCP